MQDELSRIDRILRNYKPKKKVVIEKTKSIKKIRTSKDEWLEINGINNYYRSSWERNYALYLEWLRQKGQILSWLHEPIRFDFPIKRGTNSYLPDFQVFNLDGNHEFHEVKGFNDPVSKTKMRRFKLYYPNEKLVLIDSKAYKQLSAQVSRIIEGWK